MSGVASASVLNIILTFLCRIIEVARARLRELFQEPAYKSFDMKEGDGQGLVRILMDLLKYEDDELRLSSALLLFDIFQVSLDSSPFPPPLSFSPPYVYACPCPNATYRIAGNFRGQ